MIVNCKGANTAIIDSRHDGGAIAAAKSVLIKNMGDDAYRVKTIVMLLPDPNGVASGEELAQLTEDMRDLITLRAKMTYARVSMSELLTKAQDLFAEKMSEQAEKLATDVTVGPPFKGVAPAPFKPTIVLKEPKRKVVLVAPPTATEKNIAEQAEKTVNTTKVFVKKALEKYNQEKPIVKRSSPLLSSKDSESTPLVSSASHVKIVKPVVKPTVSRPLPEAKETIKTEVKPIKAVVAKPISKASPYAHIDLLITLQKRRAAKFATSKPAENSLSTNITPKPVIKSSTEKVNKPALVEADINKNVPVGQTMTTADYVLAAANRIDIPANTIRMFVNNPSLRSKYTSYQRLTLAKK